MNKLFASVLIAAAFSLSAAASQAMPFERNQTQDGLVVPVAGGCGAGFHRGPNGGCRPNGGGPAAVVVAPGPVVVAPGAPCGGRGRHRVCNGMGACRMVCN
jgi:hypothetical protein